MADASDIKASPKEKAEGYVEALEREQAGYEAKAKNLRIDEDLRKHYADRAKQVEEEIARVKKEGVTPAPKKKAS